MTEGVLAGIISGGITLSGSLGVFLIWLGYHKREHVIIIADREKLNDLIRDHDMRVATCPMTTGFGEMNTKLAGVALKLERLEANQINAVTEKTLMHRKLDSMARDLNHVLGFLEKTEVRRINHDREDEGT